MPPVTESVQFTQIQRINLTGGTYTLNGAAVNGTFTMTGGNNGPNAGQETPGQFDFAQISGTGAPLNGGVYLGTISAGTPVLALNGNYYALSNSTIAATGSLDNTANFVYCFVKDTLISTPSGKKNIQDLCINDEILTHNHRCVKVKWVGKQVINPVFAHLRQELPIKISAHAIEINVPERDLFLSPDHAILLEGLMITAKSLVNHTTIYQVTEWEGDVEYYHIVTEHHEIILSEGTPSETLCVNGEIKPYTFVNAHHFKKAYPEGLFMEPINLPSIDYPRQLPQFIKNKLQLRADHLSKNFQLKKTA